MILADDIHMIYRAVALYRMIQQNLIGDRVKIGYCIKPCDKGIVRKAVLNITDAFFYPAIPQGRSEFPAYKQFFGSSRSPLFSPDNVGAAYDDDLLDKGREVRRSQYVLFSA
ncbi:MAG: hypothetical protein JXA44_11695 [Methanospirillaceae archaeon]|nr:hypothetical protein [Methanospirillaceae archaeon]